MKKKPTTRRRPPRKVRARRSNAQRTAETRSVIIDAAIDLLASKGHTATTTIAVAAHARVSRGAMLHHFPTRVALLIDVAKHIVALQREMRRGKAMTMASGLERFYAGADINWEIQRAPATIALLEIMMATRSDPQLRKGFAPFIAEMREMRRQAAALVAKDLGVADTSTVATMLYLHQATLRGLAVHLLGTGDETAVEEARKLFTHYSHSFARELIAREKKTSRT